MMKRGRIRFLCSLLSIVIIILLLSGCVPGDGRNTRERPAGFLWGIWHGWIAPISLILGILDSRIRIYEIFNNGWAYDFGFFMDSISGFGCISLFRKKKKK